MMGMAAAVLLSSCVKDTLYDTPHPDKGAVTISLTGLSADDNYVLDMDGKVADITGSPFTNPDLLNPGTHSMVIYNRAEGFTFDGRMARVNAPDGKSRADGASVIPLPDYLKTVSQEITVTADDTLRVNPVPQQRVRDLQLELEVTQGRPELIQSVTATLSGIAGIFDMEKGQSYNAQLKLPATPTANFYTAGYAYTYNITLNNKDIEVSDPTINPWESGDSNDASAEL